MATIYRLKDTHASNPLHKGNRRNEPCICGSGVKTKKCCGAARNIEKELLSEITELESMAKASEQQ